MAHVTLNVPDISCGHCERTIQQALGKVAGVRTVAVDIPTRRVRVDYDEQHLTVKELSAVLEGEDYPVASIHTAP
jgi:copper chaperone CopZ